MLYLYIAAILACEALAFAALKQYSIGKNPLLFVAGALLYAAVCFFLVKTFAFKDIGIVNVLWSVFSIFTVISVGVLFFHETITLREAAGVAFAVVGIVMLGGR